VALAERKRLGKHSTFVRTLKAGSTVRGVVAAEIGECIYFETGFRNPYLRMQRFTIEIEEEFERASSSESKQSQEAEVPKDMQHFQVTDTLMKFEGPDALQGLEVVMNSNLRVELAKAFNLAKSTSPEFESKDSFWLNKGELAHIGFRYQCFRAIRRSKAIVKIKIKGRTISKLILKIFPRVSLIKSVFRIHHIAGQNLRFHPLPLTFEDKEAELKAQGNYLSPKTPQAVLDWQASSKPRHYICSSRSIHVSSSKRAGSRNVEISTQIPKSSAPVEALLLEYADCNWIHLLAAHKLIIHAHKMKALTLHPGLWRADSVLIDRPEENIFLAFPVIGDGGAVITVREQKIAGSKIRYHIRVRKCGRFSVLANLIRRSEPGKPITSWIFAITAKPPKCSLSFNVSVNYKKSVARAFTYKNNSKDRTLKFEASDSTVHVLTKKIEYPDGEDCQNVRLELRGDLDRGETQRLHSAKEVKKKAYVYVIKPVRNKCVDCIRFNLLVKLK